MDIPADRTSVAARLAWVMILALLLPGCGDEKPVSPDLNPLSDGQIQGRAFAEGAPERTSDILIQIYPAGASEAVSTTHPNDEGDFTSDDLDPGTYDLTASVEDAGYFPARIPGIVVVPGDITQLSESIIVPDTSTVRFENLTPAPGAELVGRQPVISGEFRSAGSGFKIETFVLLLNGRRIREDDGLEVEELVLRRYGRFSYTPPLNLNPGEIQLRASIINRAGDTTVRPWSFIILQGVTRRVPAEFPTIGDAVAFANHGDVILVAAGTHDVRDVEVFKDLVIQSEAGRDLTMLRSSGGARHFHIFGQNRFVRIEGFTFTGGFPAAPGQGGAIFCEDADIALENCHFDGNESADRGGAVSIHHSDAIIRNCIFTGNHAYKGGAIGIFDQSSPEVAFCIFNSNSVEGSLGGAIQVESLSTPEIHHCNFFRNDAGTGTGGALMADGTAGGPSTLRSSYNLFVENVANSVSFGGTIHFKDSNVISTCDGFFDNTGGTITGTGASPQETDLLDLSPSENPRFCNLGLGDLRLHFDSPFRADGCERGAFPPGCE
jgi:hypothetical protein